MTASIAIFIIFLCVIALYLVFGKNPDPEVQREEMTVFDLHEIALYNYSHEPNSKETWTALVNAHHEAFGSGNQ